MIGSNAGSDRAPAWALNLLANPDAQVQLGNDVRHVHARVAEGEERRRLWKRMNDGYDGFDRYVARTDRELRLFVLEPVARGTNLS